MDLAASGKQAEGGNPAYKLTSRGQLKPSQSVEDISLDKDVVHPKRMRGTNPLLISAPDLQDTKSQPQLRDPSSPVRSTVLLSRAPTPAPSRTTLQVHVPQASPPPMPKTGAPLTILSCVVYLGSLPSCPCRQPSGNYTTSSNASISFFAPCSGRNHLLLCGVARQGHKLRACRSWRRRRPGLG